MSSRRVRLGFVLALLVACCSRCARGATVDRVLGGHIDQMVRTAAGMALLRDGEVLVIDAAGRLLGRCALEGRAPAARSRAGAHARRDGLDAEDFLRAAGFSADDDSAEAEAALDDEGLVPPRRRPRPAAEPTVVHAIAAAPGGDTLWIATSRGVRRARADGAGCARAALADRDVSLVAAAGPVVVAVADATVWRSTDGGRSFAVAAVLPFTARALALSDDGARLFIGGEDGAYELRGRRLERILDGPVDALASCGGITLALADGAVHAWASGETPDAASGMRLPARRLACGDGAGARWVATGVGLWTSADGLAWTEEADGLGLSVAAAARVGDRWWLATDDGLVVARAGPPALAVAPGDAGVRRPPAHPARRATWAALLPHVTVVVGGQRAAAERAEWHAWLLVTIPLEKRGGP